MFSRKIIKFSFICCILFIICLLYTTVSIAKEENKSIIIGESGDYPTITLACSDLDLEGDITFKIKGDIKDQGVVNIPSRFTSLKIIGDKDGSSLKHDFSLYLNGVKTELSNIGTNTNEGKVFGGSNKTNLKSTNLKLYNCQMKEVYGGSYNQNIDGNISLEINKHSSFDNIYGGSYVDGKHVSINNINIIGKELSTNGFAAITTLYENNSFIKTNNVNINLSKVNIEKSYKTVSVMGNNSNVKVQGGIILNIDESKVNNDIVGFVLSFYGDSIKNSASLKGKMIASITNTSAKNIYGLSSGVSPKKKGIYNVTSEDDIFLYLNNCQVEGNLIGGSSNDNNTSASKKSKGNIDLFISNSEIKNNVYGVSGIPAFGDINIKNVDTKIDNEIIATGAYKNSFEDPSFKKIKTTFETNQPTNVTLFGGFRIVKTNDAIVTDALTSHKINTEVKILNQKDKKWTEGSWIFKVKGTLPRDFKKNLISSNFVGGILKYKQTKDSAKWYLAEINNVHISFNGKDEKVIKTNTSIEVFPEPNRKGFRFLGWYDDTDKKVDSNYKFSTNTNLKSKWLIDPLFL